MSRALSYFLFARPSFLGGVAQLLDFGNTMFVYNESATPVQADHFAARADWTEVGNDLRKVLKKEKRARKRLARRRRGW